MKKIAMSAALGLTAVIALMAPDNPIAGFFTCLFTFGGWLLFIMLYKEER